VPNRIDMLRNTTAVFSGLLDASGNLLPAPTKIDIRSLPEINRADFPDVPDDMEMRLLTPANGADPAIVLFHPQSEMRLEVPLVQMNNLARYVADVRLAVERFSMGVVPDGE
jgi:hypothetical protein